MVLVSWRRVVNVSYCKVEYVFWKARLSHRQNCGELEKRKLRNFSKKDRLIDFDICPLVQSKSP